MIGISIFKIGSVTVYTHGFFLVLGVLLASAVMYYLARVNKKNTTYLLDYIVYTALFGIIGARILFYILYRSDFASIVDIFKIWQGGLVSYGGFVFGIVAFVLAVRSSKEKILPWLDLLLVSALLGLAIGRLGSFLSGEIAGIASSGTLAVNGVYSVTLFESIWDFVIFVFLGVIYLKERSSIKPGILTLEVLMLYAFGRFVIEFYRAESKIVLGLSGSQLVLAVVFLVSVVLFVRQIITIQKGATDGR
jgi:phosphatidylglycerol:prolipoprotein diacylglycerol transferase